jgi:hypothetical protein
MNEVTLHWHRASDTLPDADMTVLMWVVDDDGADWFSGWWSGEAWHDAAHGGIVMGAVTHWAEPEGPQA